MKVPADEYLGGNWKIYQTGMNFSGGDSHVSGE
jgi:hypothetical protein